MPCILIIDEDPITQLLLCDVLKRVGYEAKLTDDSVDALKILAEDAHFDVIVVDMGMSQTDGLNLVDELATYYPNIPVIISSVYTNSMVVGEVMKRRASFLPKPFTLKELKQAVHNVTLQ